MSKNLNYFQNKKINEQLKANRKKADIDKTEQNIREMLVLNGFTTAEIAALLFTVMRNILAYESNAQLLRDVGIKDMNVDTVTNIQKMLIKEFLNGLNDTKPTQATQPADQG